MHVERNGAALFLGGGQRCFVLFWPEGIGPHRRLGIAGVARPGLVVAVHELFAHGEFIAHLAQAWIHQCHGASLPRDYERDFPAGCACANFACCPVWINSCACSTGVCGRMPCPKLRMWPRPPSSAVSSSVACRIFSGGAKSTAGSRLPCTATRGPASSRTFASGMRQSTLKTFASARTIAGSRWCEAFV